jgi:tetratricopeptide (TPR) repeat protein
MRNRVTIILMAVMVCAGCQQQHARKSPVKQQYNASTAQTYLPLAQQQFAKGEYQAAAESAKKVIEAAPQLAQARTVLGKALLAMDSRTEAEVQFKEAVRIDPSIADAWYGTAILAEQSGDRPTAIHNLETAVACPDATAEIVTFLSELYLTAGDTSKALQLLDEKCRTMGGEPAIVKATAAVNLQTGHADRAVVLYEGLCQTSPKDKQLLEMLAYAYIDALRYGDAGDVLAKLCEKSPAAVQKYLFPAVDSYMRQHEYDKAVLLCDRYASQCKDNVEFWMVMARAAIGKNDASRALYAAKRAIAAEPGNSEARTLMGCAQYTDHHYADALDTFAQLGGNSSSFVRLMKGRCYARLGDRDAAAREFGEALKLDPDNTAAARQMKELAANNGSNAGLMTGR